MARIRFRDVRHAYPPPKGQEPVYALNEINLVWEDGGAYALLGPSGCGKTTLLNIISGLLTPSEGEILFDGKEVTHLPTSERQIAQVFQFPVVYDTMTVYDNLAFPLRNRGMDEKLVGERVEQIAEMLDLSANIKKRASGLTADGKQKISLGRGLVRSDVNAILFDEPLTVIDPHLKWQLRSKLKELHQQVGVTMIYVTHDQIEALTFAEKVVVMYEGTVVQVGTPVELFNHPRHTFVGYFIGSPGMNILPCTIDGGQPVFGNSILPMSSRLRDDLSGKLEVGIRPEFVEFAEDGIPVNIDKVEDLGRYQVLT
ncbi:MAG: ABC transporter ATP-binding protein, partial [Desulfofustis sp.]|nr:ABC transporter ATP-binding protein [Desulfofustis sp.]